MQGTEKELIIRILKQDELDFLNRSLAGKMNEIMNLILGRVESVSAATSSIPTDKGTYRPK